VLEAKQGDAEDYDPEYATYLVGNMLSQVERDEMAQRRENEEIYRIQNLLDRKRHWDDRTAFLLAEKLLSNRIKRHLGAREELRYLPDDEVSSAKGTVGANGHWRMLDFMHSKEKKRKRNTDDDGDEKVSKDMRVERR
jgi:hypothetical protein